MQRAERNGKMTTTPTLEPLNQINLLRPRLDNITNTGHPLLKPAHNADRMFFERGSGALDVGKGRPAAASDQTAGGP